MFRTVFGKLLIGIALGAFLVLQFTLWFGEGGVRDVHALKRAIAEQQLENERLAERNRVLEAEVKDLKNGLEAIEEHGRQDLGMIKQNETFYLVTGNPNAPAPAPAPAPHAAQAER
ncbi:MAG TPA: cell division protein FtsB [Moraxellaceae bacterium]|nr:cell division protein FtsB [Moraxellaceae bacterium]